MIILGEYPSKKISIGDGLCATLECVNICVERCLLFHVSMGARTHAYFLTLSRIQTRDDEHAFAHMHTSTHTTLKHTLTDQQHMHNSRVVWRSCFRRFTNSCAGRAELILGIPDTPSTLAGSGLRFRPGQVVVVVAKLEPISDARAIQAQLVFLLLLLLCCIFSQKIISSFVIINAVEDRHE